MNVSYKKFLAVLVFASALGLSACEQEGPAERAGEKIDQTIEQTGEKVDQATYQAGREIEEAGEDLSDTSRNTGE